MCNDLKGNSPSIGEAEIGGEGVQLCAVDSSEAVWERLEGRAIHW